jgi:hypothetical protein
MSLLHELHIPACLMNETVLQGRRIRPHDSLMVLLNTGIGYETVLNANDKQWVR